MKSRFLVGTNSYLILPEVEAPVTCTFKNDEWTSIFKHFHSKMIADQNIRPKMDKCIALYDNDDEDEDVLSEVDAFINLRNILCFQHKNSGKFYKALTRLVLSSSEPVIIGFEYNDFVVPGGETHTVSFQMSSRETLKAELSEKGINFSATPALEAKSPLVAKTVFSSTPADTQPQPAASPTV